MDEWLKDPQHVVPGNTMTFQGIPNNQQRADLLAFLKQATQRGHAPSQSAQQGGQQGGMGGMIGMGGGGSVPSLKKLDAEDRVQTIRHCGDTYKVTTADGKTRDFLGAEPAVQDRLECGGAREGRTCYYRCRHDG